MQPLVSAEVVSSRLPLLVAISIASFCRAESLIGPAVELIVADGFVNVNVPKLAMLAWRRPTVGASTIHSVERCEAVGLCVAVALWVVAKVSFSVESVIVWTKLPEPLYWTEAEIASPGSILKPEIVCSGWPSSD